MATVADLIAARLQAAGVVSVFGVPGGGSNLDLIDAAGRAGVPFVLTATETGGALAAVGQTEVTGRPGAVLATLGPGAASLANGVACALLERAPLIVFTDSHPEIYAHQRIDHRALMAPITKWSATLTADTAAATLDRAISIATSPPCGPVHLDCPGDVAGQSMSAGDDRQSPSHPATQASPDGDAIARLVAQARRPLIVAGIGARAHANAVRALSARHQLPVMVTYKAKGVVADDDPLFAGVFTNAAIEQPLIGESDVVIGIGLDPVELIPRPWKSPAPIVYLGEYAVEDRHIPFAARMIAPIPACVDLLADTLRRSEWQPAHIADHVREQRRLVCIGADGLTAQDVVTTAAARLSVSTRVVVDAGAHMFAATMLWPARQSGDMLISNGLSTMGFALPAAIGAALADRGRRTVVLTGDGGLLMCAAELLTAARERLPVIVIVFSDGSLSLIEIKQQRRGLMPSGVALGRIGWPALAAGFGAASFCASTGAELTRCLEQACLHDGPTVIEARINRTNYGPTVAAVRG